MCCNMASASPRHLRIGNVDIKRCQNPKTYHCGFHCPSPPLAFLVFLEVAFDLAAFGFPPLGMLLLPLEPLSLPTTEGAAEEGFTPLRPGKKFCWAGGVGNTGKLGDINS